MDTVDINPSEIRYENGEMVAVWPVVITSRAITPLPKQSIREEKVAIPQNFVSIVDEAKVRKRTIRIYYRATLGPQKALDVQII